MLLTMKAITFKSILAQTNIGQDDKMKVIHLLEPYRQTIDVSALSHGLHQESAPTSSLHKSSVSTTCHPSSAA